MTPKYEIPKDPSAEEFDARFAEIVREIRSALDDEIDAAYDKLRELLGADSLATAAFLDRADERSAKTALTVLPELADKIYSFDMCMSIAQLGQRFPKIPYELSLQAMFAKWNDYVQGEIATGKYEEGAHDDLQQLWTWTCQAYAMSIAFREARSPGSTEFFRKLMERINAKE